MPTLMLCIDDAALIYSLVHPALVESLSALSFIADSLCDLLPVCTCSVTPYPCLPLFTLSVIRFNQLQSYSIVTLLPP